MLLIFRARIIPENLVKHSRKRFVKCFFDFSLRYTIFNMGVKKMGVQDRDWYKEIKRDEVKGDSPRHVPLNELFDESIRKTSLAHWSIVLIFWAAVLLVMYLFFKSPH